MNRIIVAIAALFLGACGSEAERYNDPAPSFVGSAVPAYPRAKDVTSRAFKAEVENWSYGFRTSDTPYQVIAFYADAVERAGFRIREPMDCAAVSAGFSTGDMNDTRIEVRANEARNPTVTRLTAANDWGSTGLAEVSINVSHGVLPPEPSWIQCRVPPGPMDDPRCQPGYKAPPSPQVRLAPGPAERCDPTPYTVGLWTYHEEGELLLARFGPAGRPSFVMRCAPDGQILLSRIGADSATALRIRVDSAEFNLPTRRVAGAQTATVAASDPLFDSLGSGLARITVETPGVPKLVISNEFTGLFVEYCRAPSESAKRMLLSVQSRHRGGRGTR